MSLYDQIKDYADNAPEVAGLAKLNYGKVTMKPQKLVFHGKGVKPDRVEVEPGEDLKGATLELLFSVDIQEYNPSLEFQYERSVTVQKSNPKTGAKTDWSEIVLPSLEEVFGKNWHKEVDGSYVEVEDVNQVNQVTRTNRETGEKEKVFYQTIKFLRKFKNSEACLAARNETYKRQGEDVGEADELPTDVKNTVKTLYEALSKNDDIFLTAVANDERLKNYDPKVLLAAAVPF